MKNSQKGSMLVVVIVGILIVGAIGAGVSAMITSGARAGVDQNLSIQAFYAAESGLEWAGFKLREAHSDDNGGWREYCEDLLQDQEFSIEGGSSFRIDDSRLLPEDVDPEETTACRVTVEGWVGNYDNPMALRRITGRVTDFFIESEGGTADNVQGGDGVTIYDLTVGKDETAYILPGTIIEGDIQLDNSSTTYFGERVTVTGIVTLQPQGTAYFGDYFNITGNIDLKNDACFGDSVNITGNLILSASQSNVCIGENLTITGEFEGGGNNINVCIDENHSINEDNLKKQTTVCYFDEGCTVCPISDECNVLCNPPDFPTATPPNPAGTEGGEWDEG